MEYKITLSSKTIIMSVALILLQTFSLQTLGYDSNIPDDLDLEDEILQVVRRRYT